jgi:hypothetical protein
LIFVLDFTSLRLNEGNNAARDAKTGDLIGTGVGFGSPGCRDEIRRMGLSKHVKPTNNNATTMGTPPTSGNDGV